MRILSQYLSILLLASMLATPCLGFGTGSHCDLSRTVLAERGFRETPIKIVQVENWLTDYYSNSPTYTDKHRDILEKLHFDNLYNAGQVRAYWATLLLNLKLAAQTAARDDDRLAMLVTLGIGLHAVQDFYSHSNWTELHPRQDDGAFRAETFLSEINAAPESSMRGLHTGKFPDDRMFGPGPDPVPAGAGTHGGYDEGMNKDSPPRAGWDEAFVFAYLGSQELVAAMEKWVDEVRPGFWRSVRDYAVSADDEKKLDKDVMAARNISMWIDSKGQDGTWKGKGSGTTRFFTAFSPKWIGTDSSRFVKALRDGHIQDGLAAGLYSGISISAVPQLEPFSLPRTAILMKITYVGEGNKGTSLKSRLFTDSGSDFYSRIIAGGQEFWGRTMQQSRESTDPWYEILIIDPSVREVPITISVWDEDNIDPAKDQHVDVNPVPGLFDLKAVFHLSDDSLSGDVNGAFDSAQKTFSSEGTRSEKHRAIIRGFITQRPIG